MQNLCFIYLHVKEMQGYFYFLAVISTIFVHFFLYANVASFQGNMCQLFF